MATAAVEAPLERWSRLVEATPASHTVWLCQQLGSAPADVQIWAPSERTLWLRDRPAATIRNFDFEAWELFVQRKREEAAAAGSERAKTAIEVYVAAIRHWVAQINGLGMRNKKPWCRINK